MATGDDWNTRVARVQQQYNQELPSMITTFERKTRALGDIVNEVQKLEDEKGRLEQQIQMAEQDASTADREFIERREKFPDPFRPSKIYTIQDFTLFLFFMSYVIFVVAISMVSEKKMQVFLIGLLGILFLVAVFNRYI